MIYKIFRCSVDPYLFENFNTVDGDFLTAKFRAFKFPESTYVQFRGTVNVCLDKCPGVWLHFFIKRVIIKSMINVVICFIVPLIFFNKFIKMCVFKWVNYALDRM